MGKGAAPKAKAMKVQKAMKRKRVEALRKGSLRSALVAGLKASGGRDDLVYKDASKKASQRMTSTSIKERAGYPVVRAKGSADPAKWMTANGKEVQIDFIRMAWLPDTWAQGVKSTERTSKSTGGGGGTYTVWMSPDGKTFYHRYAAEAHAGHKFELKDAFKGQLRSAWLQGKQLQTGIDSDKAFFKLLSAAERRHLAKKEEFHFAIVSARRAGTPEGVRDIAMVQSTLKQAGVEPTWYVDAESLADYKALGLKAVVGGKLTPARNKALLDARRLGKVCVQCSDDISAWEYRHGKRAENRTDDAVNKAHAESQRFIVSPLAAARFMLAKMRSAPGDKKPQLGGIYPLGSCSRTWAGNEFSRQHFILGDFFVVDKSKVLFDQSMTLKEDYDFTCSHIKAHGSVLRCNRMTISVKHYTNNGGACANRDKKGVEERKNIDILQRKWPRCFSDNPKRKNEVILRWHGAPEDDE